MHCPNMKTVIKTVKVKIMEIHHHRSVIARRIGWLSDSTAGMKATLKLKLYFRLSPLWASAALFGAVYRGAVIVNKHVFMNIVKIVW